MSATLAPSPTGTTEAKPAPRLHLEFLDGLRGLAALQVLLFHFVGMKSVGMTRLLRYSLLWTQFGHLAVDAFIVLSGFCLMLPVARAADHQLRGGFRDYIRRRAWRILPPYYAALGLSLLVFVACSRTLQHITSARSDEWAATFSAGNVLSHLLMVQNINPHWGASINMALWSVGTEWQIYFIFPALLLPVWRRFGNVAAIAAGLLIGIVPQVLMPHSEYVNCACPWYCGLFAMGMVGAVITASGRLQSDARVKHLLWVAVPLALIYVGLKFFQPNEMTTRFFNVEWLKDAMGGAIAVCVILFCVRAATDEGGATRPVLLRVLESRWAVTLGTFSYSLYLIHCAVLRGSDAVVSLLHLSPTHGLLFAGLVGIPTAIGVAYLFHLAFERPFMSGFQKRAEQGAGTLPSAWLFRPRERKAL